MAAMLRVFSKAPIDIDRDETRRAEVIGHSEDKLRLLFYDTDLR